MRTVVLSDLHLGRISSHACDPEIIAPLVEGMERVLLLGDCIDLWYSANVQAEEWESRLRNICKKSGCKEVIFFRGNHDAWLKDARDYALIDTILYLHGQVFAHPLSGHGTLSEQIHAINQKHYGPHRISSRYGKKHWKLIESIYTSFPTVLIRPIPWWPSALRRMKRFIEQVSLTEQCDAKNIRGVVVGHSHRTGLRRYGENSPLVFNLGGWLKNTHACGFVRDGQNVKLLQIDNRQKPVRWGKTLYETEWSS